MASSSSGASSSSTTTPSPSGLKSKGSTDKIPSTALIGNNSGKENDLTSSNEVDTEDDINNISSSLSSAWVDDIRFSSYRLAAKLRLLQQRTGLVLLDVWNVIEAIRENGLHNVDPELSIPKAKLEALLSSMYGALAKRLPPPGGSMGGHNNGVSPSDLQNMASWLFSWIFTALKPAGASNIKVRTLKTALATLCSGKLLDKLRYLFSQLTDTNGHMMPERFAAFIRDVGRIASAVGEERQHEENPDSIFESYGPKPVTVNDFIETLMSDPGPACLSWLPLLHRIANAESVVHHGLRCASCRTESFRGLKYKSDRSPNYQLCQACFWCGHIAGEHKNDVFKEYNSFKPSSGRSTTPLSSSSLKKSMGCIQGEKNVKKGGGNSRKVPKFPDHPEKPMDLSNMMPPTSASSGTLWSHPQMPPSSSSNFHIPPVRASSAASNPISDQHYYGDMDDQYLGCYPEDEHQLIAAYAHQLATSPDAAEVEMMTSHSKHLVRELERKNREIMRDIHQLKHAHRSRSQRIMQMPRADPSIVSELEDLRHHRADLEVRLDELQTARRDLMIELEELMKLLKVNNQMYPPQDPRLFGGPPQGPQPHRPMVIISPANNRYDDVTDVSGLGIDRMIRPSSSQRGVIANEDSVNSGSD